jgi:hypothetical protein
LIVDFVDPPGEDIEWQTCGAEPPSWRRPIEETSL